MSTLLRKLPIFVLIWALGLTASPVYSQGKGKAIAKGKQRVEVKGKHGRDAGQLPFGLESYTDKKGKLPSGLQKKQDEGGNLTRGLEQGGKSLTSTGKGKRGQK